MSSYHYDSGFPIALFTLTRLTRLELECCYSLHHPSSPKAEVQYCYGLQHPSSSSTQAVLERACTAPPPLHTHTHTYTHSP